MNGYMIQWQATASDSEEAKLDAEKNLYLLTELQVRKQTKY
jgi:hypothetical protein